MILHSQKETEEKFAVKIDAVIKTSIQEWKVMLLDALMTLSKRYSLPKKLFITIDTDIAPFFIDALTEQMPLEFTISENKFEVLLLNSEKINLFSHYSPQIIQDPFLGLEAIFLQKIVLL